MQKIISLGINDVKNILREQILSFMFTLFPLLTIGVGIWGIPALAESYPEIIPYYPLILSFLLIQIAMGVGFIFASIFLEEKDQDLLVVYKTIPLSSGSFLFYRLAFGMLYMIGFGLIMVHTTQLIDVSVGESLVIALLFALTSPIITLLMSIYAQNKVEGLAVFKAINFLLLLPAVSYALPQEMVHAPAILPTHWMFQYVEASATGSDQALWYGGIAFVFGLGMLLGLVWWFRKKVF